VKRKVVCANIVLVCHAKIDRVRVFRLMITKNGWLEVVKEIFRTWFRLMAAFTLSVLGSTWQPNNKTKIFVLALHEIRI
jgi:hypothetical protein